MDVEMGRFASDTVRFCGCALITGSMSPLYPAKCIFPP